MSFYKIPLKAGQTQKQNIAGSLLLIDSLGAATGVDVTLTRIGGSDGVTMPNRQAAFRLVEPYEGVTFQSAVDTVLLVFLSDSDVQLGFVNGGAVAIPAGVQITNPIGAPVPVSIATPVTLNATAVQVNNTPAQAIPVTLHGSDDAVAIPTTINNTTAQSIPTTPYMAQVIADPAPVAVGAAAGVLLAASATRRGFRATNVGANPVAIGGAGVTFANAAVVIQPGATWNENEAPGAAWYATCAATLASTLNIQTIT